jgi:FkbM family methyltransferase
MGAMKEVVRRALRRALAEERLSAFVLSYLAENGYRFHRDCGDHQLIFNPAESMGRRLYRTGHFHRDVTDAIYAIAAEPHPDGVMLDVGANFGSQTVYAHISGRFSRVIGIEPDPANFRLLSANSAINSKDGEIELHQVAFSDKAGVARLQIYPYHSGASTLETLAARTPSGDVPEVDVRTVRGTDLLKEIGVGKDDIALIWMDVEKHEAAALDGMSELLDARPTLYFEYSYDQPSQSRVDTIDRLVFSEYPHLYLEKRALIPVSREQLLEQTKIMSGHVNILASRSPVSEERFARALKAHAT